MMPTDLALEIIRRFQAVPLSEWQFPRSNGQRTSLVERCLREVGSSFGFATRVVGGLERAFLWDVCWMDTADDERWRYTLRRIPMVAESEWSDDPERLLEDFHKINFAYAEVKVFVMWAKHFDQNASLLESVCGCPGFYVVMGAPTRRQDVLQHVAWVVRAQGEQPERLTLP